MTNEVVTRQLEEVVVWAGKRFDAAGGPAVKDQLEEVAQTDLLKDETPLALVLKRNGFTEQEHRLTLLLLATALDQALLDRYRRQFGGGHLASNALTIRELAALSGSDSLSGRLAVQRALTCGQPLFRHGVTASVDVSSCQVFEEPVRLTRAFLRLVLGNQGAPRFHHPVDLRGGSEGLPSFAVTDEVLRAVMHDELDVLVDGAARMGRRSALMILIWGPEGAGRGSVARELAGQLFSAMAGLQPGEPDIRDRMETKGTAQDGKSLRCLMGRRKAESGFSAVSGTSTRASGRIKWP